MNKFIDITPENQHLKNAKVGQRVNNFGIDGHDYIITARSPEKLEMYRIVSDRRQSKREMLGKSHITLKIRTSYYIVETKRNHIMPKLSLEVNNHGAIL